MEPDEAPLPMAMPARPMVALSALGKTLAMDLRRLSSFAGDGERHGARPTQWAPLQPDGVRAQLAAWRTFIQFRALFEFVVALDVPAVRGRAGLALNDIERVISQDSIADAKAGWRGPIRSRFNEADKAMTALSQILIRYGSEGKPRLVIVPDTSALMELVPESEPSPKTPKWHKLTMGEAGVMVILVPRVLMELDRLAHSSGHRKTAAKCLLRKLWASASPRAARWS